MSTLIFWASCVFLGVIVLSKIPGVEHFVKPVIGILFSAIESMLTNLWAWTIYVIKTLLFSHIDLMKHLVMSSEQIDPSHALREEYDKS